MYQSKFDLAIILTSLLFCILINIAKLVPCIMYFVHPNICQTLIWNAIHTGIFGVNTIGILLYVLYLFIVPRDTYYTSCCNIVISRVLGFIGIPLVVVDMVIASIALPGCVYGLYDMVTASYLGAICSTTLGIVYGLGTGLYNIYRWRSGL